MAQICENTAIKDIRPNMKNINVEFIVLDVGPAIKTKENREVRTFKVSDPTGSINVGVWDEPGKLLGPGDIVRLTKGYAAIRRSCLTLYPGKNGALHRLGDFCMNFNEQLNMSEPNMFQIDEMSSVMPSNSGAQGNNTNNGGGAVAFTQPSSSGIIQSTTAVGAVTRTELQEASGSSSSNSNTGKNNKTRGRRNQTRRYNKSYRC